MKIAIALLGTLMWAASIPALSEESPSTVKALEERYHSEVDADVAKPYQSAVADLNKKYLESLDRARTAAQERQKLDEALQLAEEAELIKKNAPVPPEDDAKSAASLKNLRSIYRASLARLEADRMQRLRPVDERHMASLNAMIGQLTRQGKLLEAKEARDILEKLQQDQPGASRREVSLKEFLPGTKWLWYGAPQNEMTFLADGTVALTDWTRKGLVTGWKVVGKNGVKLSILKGRDHSKTASLDFADDRASFTGTDFNGKAQIAKSPLVPPTPAVAPAPSDAPAPAAVPSSGAPTQAAAPPPAAAP